MAEQVQSGLEALISGGKPSGSSQGLGKYTCLVIDDMHNFRITMRQMLRAMGVDRVDFAVSGEEGVDKCRFRQYDFIFCDYNLGKARSGQQVLEMLRHEHLLKAPSMFIMVTAEITRVAVMGAREFKPDAYLAKPITALLLRDRVQRLAYRMENYRELYVALGNHQFAEAIGLCKQLIGAHREDAGYLRELLGDIYIDAGQLDDALQYFEAVCAKRLLPWAMLGIGRVYMQRQQYVPAIDAIERLVNEFPHYVEGYDLMALAYRAVNQPANAQKALMRAVKYSPNMLIRQRELAEVSEVIKDADTAAEAWKQVVRLSPHSMHHHESNYLGYARALLEQSVVNQDAEIALESVEFLDAAVRQFRGNDVFAATTNMMAARALFMVGRKEEAESRLREARRLMQGETNLGADVSMDLAQTLAISGRVEEADAILVKLMRDNASDGKLVEKINRLFEEPPTDALRKEAKNLYNLASEAYKTHDYDQSLRLFEQTLQIVPRHPGMNLNIIQVAMRKMKEKGPAPKEINLCKRAFERIDYICEGHPLKEKVDTLRARFDVMVGV